MNKKNIIIIFLTSLLVVISGLFIKTNNDFNNFKKNSIEVNSDNAATTYNIPDKYEQIELSGNQTVNSVQELSPVGPEINEQIKFPEFRTNSNKFDVKNYSTIDKNNNLKTKLVYLAPSIDTPVCEKQTKILQQFAKDHSEISVYVITADTPFAIDRFCNDKSIKNVEVLSAFDQESWLKEKNLFLKNYNTPNRMLMVLDAQNNLMHKNYEQEVTKELNVENSFAFMKSKSLLK
jgi:thiol peroxidase